jgi:uncharacterized tellurite resistance protein B-like protein
MNPSEHAPFIQLLAQVLIVDGALSDAERSYLDAVMNRLAMPADARKAALAGVSLDSPVEERVASLSDEAKRLLRHELEAAAASDGETKSVELSLVQRVRAALG